MNITKKPAGTVIKRGLRTLAEKSCSNMTLKIKVNIAGAQPGSEVSIIVGVTNTNRKKIKSSKKYFLPIFARVQLIKSEADK